VADRKDWPPVVGEQFVQAWVNLQELPGGMMQSNQPPHHYGPIPGTTSCLITTSPREAETWRAEGKPVLAIYTAAGVAPSHGALPMPLMRRVLDSLECGLLWAEHSEAEARMRRTTDEFRAWLIARNAGGTDAAS
jgi:hypothetical protein